MPTSLRQDDQPIRENSEPSATPRPHNNARPAAKIENQSAKPPSDVPPESNKGKEKIAKPRRPHGLANRPIRTKVALILVVPVVALLLFAGLRINDSRLSAQSAEDLNELAKLSALVAQTNWELQEERSGIIYHLAGNASWEEAELDRHIAGTDEALTRFREAAGTLNINKHTVQDSIDGLLENVDDLATLREDAKQQRLSTEDATAQYSSLIDNLNAIVGNVAKLATAEETGGHILAFATFMNYEEYVWQEGYHLYEVLLNGAFAPGQYRSFVNTLALQKMHLDQLRNIGSPDEVALLDKLMSPKALERITELEEIAIRGETARNIGISTQEWIDAFNARNELIKEIERHLSKSVGKATADSRDKAIQASLVEAGAVLLALVVAISISLMIARSMVRPLVRLRTSALDVAYQRLPEVVRHLKETEANADSPVQLDARTHAAAVTVTSDDEIGQVAQAFNAVHLEAIRVATDQAQLRQNVAAMFVNLARRSQLLVDRLIRLIDKLEQGERDPDRLSELFKLDHLATRMRRNDENLMVLAGAEGGRRWERDAELVDVLRAAISEVEQYTRVRMGHVDQVEVAAPAVSDVVHLVAELLENATSFSSPRTDVLVDARLVGGQVVIEIEDEGIGMSAEQLDDLNDRLSRPPAIDVSVSRMMGLFVVGRLAARHGVRVMLRSSVGGGVLSIVALPNRTLVNVAPLNPARPHVTADVQAALPTGQVTAHGAVPADPGTLVPPQRNATENADMSTSGPQPKVQTPPPTQWRYTPGVSDSTQEMPLPIFEQIESEWFRPPAQQTATTPPPRPQSEPQSGEAAVAYSQRTPVPDAQSQHPTVPLEDLLPPAAESAVPTSPTIAPASLPTRDTRVPSLPDNSTPSTSIDKPWDGPADTGWNKAEQLTEPKTGNTTKAGLPRRVPMANFVPGAVEQPVAPTKPASHRSPDAVRGVLSSYRRGIEQGRQAGQAEATETQTQTPTNDHVEEK